jgi:c(7)-type cytochrome triheme protein
MLQTAKSTKIGDLYRSKQQQCMFGGKARMKVFVTAVIMVLLFANGKAYAQICGTNFTYEGKGAGEVVFDPEVHLSKGLTCSECHEGRGLISALFEMKKGANEVSMRKMSLGRSCGYCHDGKKTFSTTDDLQCAKCHHK